MQSSRELSTLEEQETIRKTTRFIEEEPQTYKVVGYSVKRPSSQRRLTFNIGLSNDEALDIRPFMNKMTLLSS